MEFTLYVFLVLTQGSGTASSHLAMNCILNLSWTNFKIEKKLSKRVRTKVKGVVIDWKVLTKSWLLAPSILLTDQRKVQIRLLEMGWRMRNWQYEYRQGYSDPIWRKLQKDERMTYYFSMRPPLSGVEELYCQLVLLLKVALPWLRRQLTCQYPQAPDITILRVVKSRFVVPRGRNVLRAVSPLVMSVSWNFSQIVSYLDGPVDYKSNRYLQGCTKGGSPASNTLTAIAGHKHSTNIGLKRVTNGNHILVECGSLP